MATRRQKKTEEASVNIIMFWFWRPPKIVALALQTQCTQGGVAPATRDWKWNAASLRFLAAAPTAECRDRVRPVWSCALSIRHIKPTNQGDGISADAWTERDVAFISADTLSRTRILRLDSHDYRVKGQVSPALMTCLQLKQFRRQQQQYQSTGRCQQAGDAVSIPRTRLLPISCRDALSILPTSPIAFPSDYRKQKSEMEQNNSAAP